MQHILNQLAGGKEPSEIAGQTRGKPPVEPLEGLVIVGCDASEKGQIVLVTIGHWRLLLVRCVPHLLLLWRGIRWSGHALGHDARIAGALVLFDPYVGSHA
jgi:hypothetical protein